MVHEAEHGLLKMPQAIDGAKRVERISRSACKLALIYDGRLDNFRKNVHGHVLQRRLTQILYLKS